MVERVRPYQASIEPRFCGFVLRGDGAVIGAEIKGIFGRHVWGVGEGGFGTLETEMLNHVLLTKLTESHWSERGHAINRQNFSNQLHKNMLSRTCEESNSLTKSSNEFGLLKLF